MFLGRVVGRVVSTAKDPGLTGRRLLIVQPVKPDLTATGKQLVMLDAVGAGADKVPRQGSQLSVLAGRGSCRQHHRRDVDRTAHGEAELNADRASYR